MQFLHTFYFPPIFSPPLSLSPRKQYDFVRAIRYVTKLRFGRRRKRKKKERKVFSDVDATRASHFLPRNASTFDNDKRFDSENETHPVSNLQTHDLSFATTTIFPITSLSLCFSFLSLPLWATTPRRKRRSRRRRRRNKASLGRERGWRKTAINHDFLRCSSVGAYVRVPVRERMGSLNRFFGSIVQKYTEEDRGGRTTRRVVTRNVTQTTRGRRSVDCDRSGRSK